MRPRSFFILALCGLFCFTKHLSAEIELVTIKWPPGICTESCRLGLEKKLRTMNDVAEVVVTDVQATLRWKPNHRMVYSSLENTMAMIGVSMDELQITVRGTIKQMGKEIKLISIGDNTEFTLLGPVQIDKNNAPILENPQTLKLSEETRQKFIAAEKQFKVVTVQGPFFEPERAPPYYIIAEKIQISPSLVEGAPPQERQQQQAVPQSYYERRPTQQTTSPNRPPSTQQNTYQIVPQR